MITKSVSITVDPNEGYTFDVCVSSDELFIAAWEADEHNIGKVVQKVNFGSVDEVRAVARAMLQACTIADGQP